MRRKGRFVVEASLLVPGICIVLVYLFFYTLYAHDYAVCIHAAIESGVGGTYREGQSPGQIADEVEEDLRRKLPERLLWIRQSEVEVKANAARVTIRISGTGSFLPVEGIKVKQAIYRNAPCELIRRSRWLQSMGG